MLGKFLTSFRNATSGNINGNHLDVYSVDDFNSLLCREQARADRNNQKFSIILFAIDKKRFSPKHINEFLGFIAENVRISDICGWYSEDNIALILPDTIAEGAWMLADKIFKETDIRKEEVDISVFQYPSPEWMARFI